MRLASHIAAAPSAAIVRSLRPAAWQVIAVCLAGRGFSFGRMSQGNAGTKQNSYRSDMSKPD